MRLPLAALLALACFPAAASSDVLCSGACTVDAAVLPGYSPALLVISNGTNVSWHATDIGHNQRETATPLGSPTPCFSVPSPLGNDSLAVTFDASGSALTATWNGTTRACTNAIPLDDGAFLLAYHCTLHANMRGALVVTVD
jgi:plastocyanin